jgi:hypothetical protein
MREYGALYSKCDMRFQLAQYRWKRLSEDIELGILDFKHCQETFATAKNVKLKFGICHAIAIWVDYGVEISDQVYNFISTGDKFHQQAVRFLVEPIRINKTADKFIEISMTLGSVGKMEDHDFRIKVVNGDDMD